MLKEYQKAFIELALQVDALKFGEFTLKSGRISPYFFNAGAFYLNTHLAKLGEIYAAYVAEHNLQFDCLFGPAYKGIPLVCALAIYLHQNHGIEVPYAFNRKEAKAHGEKGVFIGAPIKGKLLLVDDVITKGTAILESIDLVKNEGAQISEAIVLIDRQEKGNADKSAIEEIEIQHNIKVHSIIGLNSIIQYLLESKQNPLSEKYLPSILAYREQYGTKAS